MYNILSAVVEVDQKYNQLFTKFLKGSKNIFAGFASYKIQKLIDTKLIANKTLNSVIVSKRLVVN